MNLIVRQRHGAGGAKSMAVLLFISLLANPIPMATTFSYQAEASLLQIDSLKIPYQDRKSWVSSTRPRSLGLRRMRLSLDMHQGEVGELSFVFRPDAGRYWEVSKEEPALELDARAGESYEPMPSVRLLDAYQLHWYVGGVLSFSYGVWEQLAVRQPVFEEVLPFALMPQLPAKFSGGRLRVGSADGKNSVWSSALYIYQGDEDRAEEFASRKDGSKAVLGEGPSVSDHQQGMALSSAWNPISSLRLQTVLGGGESIEMDVKRSEQFAQLAAVWSTKFFGRSLGLHWDSRLVLHEWRSVRQKFAPRRQWGLNLGSEFEVYPKQAWTWGLYLGSAQFPKSAEIFDKTREVFGWQLESGYLSELSPGFTLTAMMNQEWRYTKASEDREQGAFTDGDQSHAILRRFGIELNYLLSGNS